MTKPHKREARRKRKTGINSNFSAQTVTEKVEVNLNDEYLEFMLQSARHRKERGESYISMNKVKCGY